jgi:hypothetical protein
VTEVAFTPSLDEVSGLVPGRAVVTWRLVHESDGWRISLAGTTVGPRFADESGAPEAARIWLAQRIDCANAEEYEGGLLATPVWPSRCAANPGRSRWGNRNRSTIRSNPRNSSGRSVPSSSVESFPAPEAVILPAETLAVQGRQAEADIQFELVRTIARLQQGAGQVVDLEMARFETDHGDPARALSLAREVYRIRPTVHAADTLVWALFRSGRPGAALPRIEEALRLGSLDPVLRYHGAAVFLAAAKRSERPMSWKWR